MNAPLPFEKHTKMLLGMKRFREALLVTLKWVEAHPENATAWFYRAFAESNVHQPNAALTSIERALELKPGNHLMLAQQAQILGILGRSRECLQLLDDLVADDQLPQGLLHQIGTTYNNVGRHDQAVGLFERVRDLQPENTANLVSLGTAYHILGRSDEARDVQRTAIDREPDNFRAYWLLGQMRKAKGGANDIALFEKTLQQNSDKLQARICLNFALAKQYEELERFDEAFSCLQRGSAAVLEHTPYDESRDRQLFTTLGESFDTTFCQTRTAACDSRDPVFIVGMPRTGTTLLEQILITDSEMETAGELHQFGHLLNQACASISDPKDAYTMYRAANRIDWRALGRAYIESARLHVNESPRFIDKYPLNFLFVGPLLRALPNARVINLRRNPMDTCFSNYKLLYRLGSALHTYDLEAMARYYLRYTELMAHWHNCLPGQILDVEYEELVTNPETETQRVFDFLNMTWRPECLDFYKAGGAVATASTTQVRRPINTGSLHKWRKFEHYLEPLRAALESATRDAAVTP